MMQIPDKIVNILDIQYPVYVQPLREGVRTIYHPEKGLDPKPKNENILLPILSKIKDWVLEGYISNNKFYISDVVFIEEWGSKVYDEPYRERIRFVRDIIALLSAHKYVIDEATDLVDDSVEIVRLYRRYLNEGHKGVILRNKEGFYRFDEFDLSEAPVRLLYPNKEAI